MPEDEAASSSQPEEIAESEAPAEPAGEPSSESSPAPESEPEPAPSASTVPQLVPAVASLASKASVLPLSTTASGDEVQIEQPEEGAEFQVYLASAGSYENAKETERDLLITDSYGFARSKGPPIRSVRGASNRRGRGAEICPRLLPCSFPSMGKTYYYILNNPTFTSLIRFEKKDLESGKIYSSCGNCCQNPQIPIPANGWCSIINYPSPIDIRHLRDRRHRHPHAAGTPGLWKLRLVEQQSPWGYVFDGEPVPFVVDGTQDVVTVEKYNIAQKGTITVGKTGEIFSSVVESDGMYQPVYTIGGTPNTHYIIEAVGDIYTPDGTLRYKDKQVVARLQTGEDGTATTEPLYLGTFKIFRGKSSARHGD